jgi:hypothetical protein
MRRERADLEHVLLERAQPPTHVEVVAVVKRYAQNCTLGNIREQWNRSIARAVLVGVKKDTDDTNTAGGNTAARSSGESIDLETAAPAPRSRSIFSTGRYVVR